MNEIKNLERGSAFVYKLDDDNENNIAALIPVFTRKNNRNAINSMLTFSEIYQIYDTYKSRDIKNQIYYGGVTRIE